MNTSERQPPRFVPTLTEVVDPQGFNSTNATPGDDVESLVTEILQKLQPMVARKMRDESEQWLRATLAQHLRDINTHMHGELESMVRQAVLDALKTKS